jgi:cytochrome c biogenesis factor
MTGVLLMCSPAITVVYAGLLIMILGMLLALAEKKR